MNPFTEPAKQASKETDKALAGKIAALSSLPQRKVERLLPEKRDKKQFLELIEMVKDETEMDEQLTHLETHVKTLGPVIFKVLRGFL
ncbi:hypothetical protein C6495_02070 [Candidatus Poribacteria bacterium]|nr:MAG: hypothetical protein C6495_02070 [Candidatus Poribacteria bacterium]